LRVLWLTPELPFFPGGSGGSTRQHQLIVQLLAHGHDVDVVAPVHVSQRDGAAALRATGARLYDVQRPASRAAETLAAVRAHPALLGQAATLPWYAWQVEVFWASLHERMREAVDAAWPDVIHIEHDWAARWHDDLPAGVPTTLGLENLSWLYHEHRGAAAGGQRGALQRAQARRFKRFDRERLGRFSALLAVSQTEGRDVAALVPGVPVHVIANGVDTDALRPAPLPSEPVALYTGTFAYGPNAEGLAWLLRDVWPRVTAQVPGARLIVVGGGVPDELAALAGPEVEIAGRVPEMQPWFDRARTVLVPILSGAGTRLKVLDGLASGRPVVSTLLGADGIDVQDGRDVLLADGAEALAAAAARALTDDDQAARHGAAGRALGESNNDMRAIGARLAEVLRGLVDAPA
jgi:glycosyltransferase involved in cell wall biosynthesis